MNIALIKVLGLSNKEKKVLQALHEGMDSPASISAYTSVSRPSVYSILKKLKNRGLVDSYIRDGKKKWCMVTDDQITTLFAATKKALLSSQKEHEEIYHAEDSKVSFYFGKDAMRNKLFEIFSVHKNQRWTGVQGQHDLDGWSSFMSEEDTKKINAMIKNNKLIVHGLLPEGWVDHAFNNLGKEWAKEYGGRMANIHYLDKKYFDHAGQLYIFKDVIYIMSLNKKMLIEIQEKEMANMIALLIQHAMDTSHAVDVNKRVSQLLG